jgi:hypothetical protein
VEKCINTGKYIPISTKLQTALCIWKCHVAGKLVFKFLKLLGVSGAPCTGISDKFQEWILAYIVHVDHLKRYRFVFKHLVSSTLGKERISVTKKRYIDFCKGNILKVRFVLFSGKWKLKGMFVLKLACWNTTSNSYDIKCNQYISVHLLFKSWCVVFINVYYITWCGYEVLGMIPLCDS